MQIIFKEKMTDTELTSYELSEVGFVPVPGDPIRLEYENYTVSEREYHFEDGYIIVYLE